MPRNIVFLCVLPCYHRCAKSITLSLSLRLKLNGQLEIIGVCSGNRKIIMDPHKSYIFRILTNYTWLERGRLSPLKFVTKFWIRIKRTDRSLRGPADTNNNVAMFKTQTERLLVSMEKNSGEMNYAYHLRRSCYHTEVLHNPMDGSQY